VTLLEEIQQNLQKLPPEKQSEVLDFIAFLQARLSKAPETHGKPRSLRSHPAFGSWKQRGIDALEYEHALRSEWDVRP
jgi:hypothetical protein